jgi:hypothetical protein
MSATDIFKPSAERQGLDELLRRYPHFDLLGIIWGDDIETAKQWIIVELGQPSRDGDAWARWYFGIWRATGAVYRSPNPHGPIADDPIITLDG